MAQRLNLKPAAAGLYSHHFEPISLLSLDFSDLVVSRVIETVPRNNYRSVQGGMNLRLAPQKFPPFGRAYLKSAGFFIPEKELIEYSDALHSRMQSYRGEPITTPYMDASLLNKYFYDNRPLICTQIAQVDVTSSTNPQTDFPDRNLYDFVYVTLLSNDQPRYTFLELNTTGRKIFKLFKSLGYDFYDPAFKTSYSAISPVSDFKVNILPLLAYCKVYVDMFLSGVFYNNNNLVYLLKCIHDNEDCYISGTQYYSAGTGALMTTLALSLIVDSILVPFEQNMYTSAWNSPNSPDGLNPAIDSAMPSDLLSPISPINNSNTASNISASSRINTLQTPSGTTISNLSSFGLRMLDSFDRFVRRWNLAGTKAVQRLYASLGIKSDTFKSDFAHKLFETSERLRFHPVLSNADTHQDGGQYLGHYAGFSALTSGINFSYQCTDYGYLIIVHWLQVTPIIPRGFDPSVLRMNGLDWYSPDYDGKALRAVPNVEISVLKEKRSVQMITSDPRTDRDIFGFINLYDDYRNMRDNVSGDMMDIVKDYAFMRDYSVLRQRSDLSFKPQSNDVQYYGKLSGIGLTDVFMYDRTEGDRFWLEVDYSIDVESPVKSDSESVDLNGEGDLVVQRNGAMMS